jgi:TetR/AcrR family fatty acid metabolism transcriptional regulator
MSAAFRSTSTRALPPDEKRQVIFAAAREVIVERGFDAAKMDEIAARAGVGKGTLYNFFISKEELFLNLVLEHFQRIRDMVERERDGIEDPWAEMEATWRALMLKAFPELMAQWNLTYQLWGFLARDGAAREQLFASWRTMYREREARLVRSIRDGQASGHFRADVDAPLLAPLLLAVFDGLLNRSMVDAERSDPHTALRAVLDLCRRLLTP